MSLILSASPLLSSKPFCNSPLIAHCRINKAKSTLLLRYLNWRLLTSMFLFFASKRCKHTSRMQDQLYPPADPTRHCDALGVSFHGSIFLPPSSIFKVCQTMRQARRIHLWTLPAIVMPKASATTAASSFPLPASSKCVKQCVKHAGSSR